MKPKTPVPKWYLKLLVQVLFLINGLRFISGNNQNCKKPISIKPKKLEINTIPGSITLEDQQKYTLASMLIPKKLDDTENVDDLKACTQNSHVIIEKGKTYYTLTVAFEEKMSQGNVFVSSSMSGHNIEVNEDRKTLIVKLCTNEEEVIGFYQNEFLDYKESDDKINVIIFMLENSLPAMQAGKAELQTKSISIQLHTEGHSNSCSAGGSFNIFKEDSEATDEGEKFTPFLELPSEDGKALNKVYLKKMHQSVMNQICNSLGYKDTELIFQQIKGVDFVFTTPLSEDCFPILET